MYSGAPVKQQLGGPCPAPAETLTPHVTDDPHVMRTEPPPSPGTTSVSATGSSSAYRQAPGTARALGTRPAVGSQEPDPGSQAGSAVFVRFKLCSSPPGRGLLLSLAAPRTVFRPGLSCCSAGEIPWVGVEPWVSLGVRSQGGQTAPFLPPEVLPRSTRPLNCLQTSWHLIQAFYRHRELL